VVGKVIQRFIELCMMNEPTEFIEKRGYDPKIVKALNIGFCTTEVYSTLIKEFGMDVLKENKFVSANGLHKYLNRVIFKYSEEYFTARKIDTFGFSKYKNLFPAGLSKRPYVLKGTENVVYVCEGETDAVALMHLYPNAWIVSLGGTTMVLRLKYFIKALYLKRPKIIFAFDKDETGVECLEKAIKVLKAQELYYLLWKGDYKDIDECFRNKIELKEKKIETKAEEKRAQTYYSYPSTAMSVIKGLADLKGMAEMLWTNAPFFYDKHKMFWFWNKKEFFYEQVDETELLNTIDDLFQISSLNTGQKSSIVEALKQVGRKHIPKQIKKWWVQFNSKVIDIDTGNIFAADPNYFFTTSIPWDIGESEEIPTIKKYIEEWVVKEGLQDKTYIDTMIEIIAYCCFNNQFLQTMFAFTGVGSNGKGTFRDILKKFIGERNYVSSEMKLLATKQFETSSIYRKAICAIPEVDAYDMKNTVRIKQLCGEDPLRFEFKGKTPFTDYSQTKIIVLTNSLPVTQDRSIGFYRRWLIVDFPYIFNVGKDIIADIPNIEFNNLAKLCIRVMKELKERKQFTNGGNFEQRRQRYEDRSNPMEKFVNEECEENTPLVPIPCRDFYKEVNKWLKHHNLREMKNSQIKSALKTMDIEVGARTKRDGDNFIRQSGVWIAFKEPKEVQKVIEIEKENKIEEEFVSDL